MPKNNNFTYEDQNVLRRRKAYWLIIAANAGYSDAQAQLAASYEFGVNGVKVDKVAAAYWLKRSTGELIPGRNDFDYEKYYLEKEYGGRRSRRDKVNSLSKKNVVEQVEEIDDEDEDYVSDYAVDLGNDSKDAVPLYQQPGYQQHLAQQTLIQQQAQQQAALQQQQQQQPIFQQPVQTQPVYQAQYQQPVQQKAKFDLSKPEVDLVALEQQAKSGNPKSEVAYAIELLKNKDTEKEGFSWLQKAEALGLSDATYEIALCYLNGVAVSKDTNEGLEKLYAAISRQNPKAISKLADLRIEGKLVPKDTQLAFQEFSDAAKRNDPFAMYRLGSFYGGNGLGIEKNLNLAADWYEKAAILKEPNAQCQLGLFYYYGKGGKQVDKNKAKDLLISSAKQDNQIALSMLDKLF
jgi:TPR repeat protein